MRLGAEWKSSSALGPLLGRNSGGWAQRVRPRASREVSLTQLETVAGKRIRGGEGERAVEGMLQPRQRSPWPRRQIRGEERSTEERAEFQAEIQ